MRVRLFRVGAVVPTSAFSRLEALFALHAEDKYKLAALAVALTTRRLLLTHAETKAEIDHDGLFLGFKRS